MKFQGPGDKQALDFFAGVAMKRFLLLLIVFCCSLNVSGRNRHYCVSVFDGDEWSELDVRDALCSDAGQNHAEMWNDWDNSKELRDTMQFAIFENAFDQPLRVRVRKNDSFENVRVRPTNYDIRTKRIDDNTIEFVIPSFDRSKLSVEFDGDRQHNLFLIGHRPDTLKPNPGDPGVKYFGPGEHDAGNIVLQKNEQLYIDFGAVVYGTVRITGDNCTIAGHGILSGERLEHKGDVYSNGLNLVIANPYSKFGVLNNLVFRDLTLIDSPSWNLTVFNSDNVLIDGINMISWELNGDGIDLLSCTNAIIRNCLLRTYDDCITLKVRHTSNPMSDMADTKVYNNLIFNDYARGIVVGIENGNTRIPGGGHIHDIEVHDCIILQNSRSEDVRDLRAGIAIGQAASPEYVHMKGSARKLEKIYVHDIIFDNLDPSGRCFSLLQYPDMAKPCEMDDIRIENFYVYGGSRMNTPAGLVITNQHTVTNMMVRNFFVDGRKLKGPGLDFVIIGDAEVKFE